MKNKKTLILVAILIILVGIGAFILLIRDPVKPSKNETGETSIIDPAEYLRCVESGGVASKDMFPRSCVLKGITYYEANK